MDWTCQVTPSTRRQAMFNMYNFLVRVYPDNVNGKFHSLHPKTIIVLVWKGKEHRLVLCHRAANIKPFGFLFLCSRDVCQYCKAVYLDVNLLIAFSRVCSLSDC